MKKQISRSKLKTPRGEAIGIGRIHFSGTSKFEQSLPEMPFIVIKKEDGAFVSTCIQLRVDGYGKTVDEARVDMADNIWSFLNMNFNDERSKNRCWLNILDLCKVDRESSLLWDKYHAVQLSLAEMGIGTDIGQRKRFSHGFTADYFYFSKQTEKTA